MNGIAIRLLWRLVSWRLVRVAGCSIGLLAWLAGAVPPALAASGLPLVDQSNLNWEYKGAFRLRNHGNEGESRIGYTTGEFALTPGAGSFYVTGHVYDLAVAQYNVPTLGPSAGEGASVNNVPAVGSLPLISTTQPFVKLKPKAPSIIDGVSSDVNRITGLEYTADNQLVVNWLEYYDADASNTDTTLVINDPSNLSGSTATGFHKLEGAGHITGWASEVPAEWQSQLGSDYLFGYASNYAINGRSSIGPSAFGVDIDTVLGEQGYGSTIPTTPFIDYDLEHELHDDRYNNQFNQGIGPNGEDNGLVGDNDLWTEVSQARYGFIIPGTSTYMVVGHSGGHESGIFYKGTQDNGTVCGGPCAREYQDYYNQVWFYDVEDMLAVQEGTMQTYDVQPYSYGKLDLPYQPDPNDPTYGFYAIGGADYDEETRQLFMLLVRADSTQSIYERAPVMLVYQLPEFGMSGDFDQSGYVDGGDFLAWQRNPTLGDLEGWKANYEVSGLSGIYGVPEPNCARLMVCILLVLIGHRGV